MPENTYAELVGMVRELGDTAAYGELIARYQVGHGDQPVTITGKLSSTVTTTGDGFSGRRAALNSAFGRYSMIACLTAFSKSSLTCWRGC